MPKVTELVHSRARFEPTAGCPTQVCVCPRGALTTAFQGRVKEQVTLETNSEAWVPTSRQQAGEVVPGVHTKVS